MVNTGTWVYQGRQQHQWFGHGTAPKDNAAAPHPAADSLFAPEGVERRIDYAAISVIGHLPHKDRSRWAASRYDAPPDRLRTTVAAWYLASGQSRDRFRESLLDPYTGDETVNRLRSAAHGIVEARSHAELGLASKQLAEAVKTIGVERWPRYLADAERRATRAVTDGELPGVTKASFAGVAGGPAGIAAAILLAITLRLISQGSAKPKGAESLTPGSTPEPATPPILETAVPIPPPKDNEITLEVIRPDGKRIGSPGNSKDVREVPGGASEAEELFERLTKGGTDITPSDLKDAGGKLIRLPNGDEIGYRPTSDGGPPTIDVKVKEPIHEVWIYAEYLACRRIMMRIMARRTKAAAHRTCRSKSRASLRWWLIQPIVRSTIHRFGSTTKRCWSHRRMIWISHCPVRATAAAIFGP